MAQAPIVHEYHVINQENQKNKFDKELARQVCEEIDYCMIVVENAGTRMSNGKLMLIQLESLKYIREDLMNGYELIKKKPKD